MALEPTFSGDDLLATVGPHVDMLEELRDTFAEQYPEVLAAIRGAAAAQNARLLADKAHLMKNVAAMAGGPSSRQLSIAIEDAAKAGDYGRATQLDRGPRAGAGRPAAGAGRLRRRAAAGRARTDARAARDA